MDDVDEAADARLARAWFVKAYTERLVEETRATRETAQRLRREGEARRAQMGQRSPRLSMPWID